jgi:hypothetical protein
MLNARITANREAVHNTAVKIDLVWLLGLNQDGLGLVALLGGEDIVRLGGGDG